MVRLNYGIIDLGSNSLRLEIFKLENHKLTNIFSKREVVGLASYLLPEGYISDLGIDSVIRVVKEFIEVSQAYSLEKMYVIATATIREARNQNEILTRIKRASGMHVELLDEDKEGLYGYKGVLLEHQIDQGLIIDIGGGSTELSLVTSGQLIDSASLNLGSLNTYISYVKEIFPTHNEMERISGAVMHALTQHEVKKGKPSKLHMALVVQLTLHWCC